MVEVWITGEDKAAQGTATVFYHHGYSPWLPLVLFSTSFHFILLPTYLLFAGESKFKLSLFVIFCRFTIIGDFKLKLQINHPN